MARILIVDDQPVILKILDSLLTKAGHLVTTSTDAYDAIDKLGLQPFELVITDAIMPGGASGFDLIKTIRKKPELTGLPIILLTGKREKKDVDRGIQVGADDYIVKPIDTDILLAKVSSLLQNSKVDGSPFIDCPVSEEAGLHLALHIVGVSEVGLRLSSPQPMQPNSKFLLQSSFFAAVGMSVPHLRVTSCVPDADSFMIRAQYIGVSESSLQPLRVWMRSHRRAG